MTPLTAAERRITRREWLWLAAASLLAMAVFSAPYLVALRSQTEAMRFGGHLLGIIDANTYIAKMRYGANGPWLLKRVYTTAPHAGGFAYFHYILLGKLAAWVTGQGAHVRTSTLLVAFHAMRVAAGLALLAVIYRFAADYLRTPAQRRLAWAVASFAGGLGFAGEVARAAAGAGASASTAVEYYVPEAFTMLLLYGLPHLAAARALLIGGWLVFFRAVDGTSWRRALLAGALWAGMSVIIPFDAALLGVLIAAWLLALWIAQRHFPLAELRLAAVAGAPPLTLLLYDAWLFTQNPVFAIWARQNALPSPALGAYLMAYGLLLAFVAVGLAAVFRHPLTRRRALLVSWPLAALVMAYLPVGVQRRLLEGVIVPLGVLAAFGIWRLVGEPPEEGAGLRLGWRLRQVGVSAVVMVLFGSAILLVGGGLLAARTPREPAFLPAGQVAALNWLREEAPPGSVVLATYETGNVIPAYAGVRVYIGHGPETVDARRKEAEARAFFLGGMTDDSRRALLDTAGADYVYIGPAEASSCPVCFDPAALGLRPVYDAGGVTIYAVEGR